MTPIIDTDRQQVGDTTTPVCKMDGGAWHLECFTDDGRAFIDLQAETMSITTATELRSALDSAIHQATHRPQRPTATEGRGRAAILRAAHLTVPQVAPVLGIEDSDLAGMLDGSVRLDQDTATRLYALVALVAMHGE